VATLRELVPGHDVDALVRFLETEIVAEQLDLEDNS
jgi:hypothetical protein